MGKRLNPAPIFDTSSIESFEYDDMNEDEFRELKSIAGKHMNEPEMNINQKDSKAQPKLMLIEDSVDEKVKNKPNKLNENLHSSSSDMFMDSDWENHNQDISKFLL